MKLRASKCIVKEVPIEEERRFLETNHLQGYCMSEVAYGLYYGNELVQIETFGSPRIEVQSNTIWHDWELLRECSKKDVQVYGGKSCLLKHFEQEKKPLNLLSYCDTTAGFDGHSYAACGFTLEHVSADYWYEYNGEVIKRYRMQKNANYRMKGKKEPIQLTLEKYGKTYDPNLTEKQNAINAGFVLMKGTGQQVWSKRYSDNIGYIYCIENTVNGKLYIGQHTLYKNGILKSPNYFGSGTVLQRAVAKYGKRSFKRRVLEWVNNCNYSLLCERENYWHELYQEKYGSDTLYNVASTNENAVSQKWRDDAVKAVSAIKRSALGHKGKHFFTNGVTNTLADECPTGYYPGLTKKERNNTIQKPMSDETKEKLRKANLGKKRDTSKYVQLNEKKEKVMDERAKKISETLKGIKRKPMANETKALIAEAARKQRESELNKIHEMGYKTKAELEAIYGRKKIPEDIKKTMVKFGKWNCYKVVE